MLDDEVSVLEPVPMVLEPLVEPDPVAELLELGVVVLPDELLGLVVLIEPLVPVVPVVPLLVAPLVPLPLVVDEGLVVDDGLVDDEVPEPLVPVVLLLVPLVPLVPLPLMLPPWLGDVVTLGLPWSTGVAPGPDCVPTLVPPPAEPPAPVPVALLPPLLVPLEPEPLDWANATPTTAARETAAAIAVFLKLLILDSCSGLMKCSRVARYRVAPADAGALVSASKEWQRACP